MLPLLYGRFRRPLPRSAIARLPSGASPAEIAASKMRCARLAAPFVTALCIFDTLRGGSAARRSRPLIRRSLFRRSSTIRVAMLRRRRRPCWRAGVPAPCLACVLSRPSKTAPALDSLRSLLASSPSLVALTSWFQSVRIPPQHANRLHAIVSNLFLFIH